MQNEKLRKDWELLMFRAKPHFEQTQNLTRHLMSFHQRELVNMSPVMPETLEAMRFFIPRIPPKNQTEFRRQLAYLVELRGLQADAWTDAIQLAEKDAERNSNALKNMVQSWE